MTNPKIQQLQEHQSFIRISEQYPHIAKKLIIFWGSEFCEPYLDTLFTDTRSDTRKGFPPEDMRALLNIRRLHEKQYDFDRKHAVWTYPH